MRVKGSLLTKALLGCMALILGVISPGYGQPTQQWRILALRASFPKEEPDNPTTTGDGTFDLGGLVPGGGPHGYTFPYDIPPHDRQYSEWHLESLATYYDRVSEGQIRITFDVFPTELDSSYVLPRQMAEYGRERTKQGLEQALCELFRDAVSLADTGEQPGFADYNCVVVFHAGLGRETGQPNDIPSAYLYPEDFETYLGGPVQVDGGLHQIERGIILPEAASFTGTAGLNGIIAKFFGHHLGLPGFSNYRDNLPGAGGWCLMDTGDANYSGEVFGFVPCHPMIWSKVALGWVSPVTVTRDTTLQIAATHLLQGAQPKAVMLPVSTDEYLLLENRQADDAGQDFSENVTFSVGDTAGVCLSAAHYDAYVPGSGVLIWHVNDRIIREKRAAGEINNDFAHRGLYLEEADGYRDIGNPYIQYDRAVQINGSGSDPFYVGGETVFSRLRSDLGAETGITVEVESPSQDVMTVQITFERSLAGWPIRTDASFTKNAPTLAPDGQRIFAIGDDGRLFAWDAHGVAADTSGAGDLALRDGEPRAAYGDLDLDDLQDSVWVQGDTLWIDREPVGLDTGPYSPPVLGDIDADGYLEVVFCGVGAVYAYNANGLPAAGFPTCLPRRDGVETIPAAPVLADLDGDGILEIVLGTRENGLYAVDGLGKLVNGFPLLTIGGVETSPLFSDLDHDGALELSALTDSGFVHAWRMHAISPSFTAGMEGVVWGEYGQDAHNSFTFPDSLLALDPAGPADRFLYDDRAYCYPNPVEGNACRLRFYLGRQAAVHIKVFNGAGQIVDQLDKEETQPQMENEVVWDTRNRASGLYLCRIEAGGDVVWLKAAVAK